MTLTLMKFVIENDSILRRNIAFFHIRPINFTKNDPKFFRKAVSHKSNVSNRNFQSWFLFRIELKLVFYKNNLKTAANQKIYMIQL